MRHIPASDTAHAGVLSFEDALVPSADDFDREHWLYVPDHYSEYRYILGTRGQRPLICIGINPSTAVPGRLDNTLKSTERVALHNGSDSFIMFNVYAQRATDPDDMEKELNPVLHRENMKAFDWLLSRLSCVPDLWAAWGPVICRRPWLPGCVLDMAARSCPTVAAGFLHVPWQHEQVLCRPHQPSLSGADILRGVTAGLRAVISQMER